MNQKVITVKGAYIFLENKINELVDTGHTIISITPLTYNGDENGGLNLNIALIIATKPDHQNPRVDTLSIVNFCKNGCKKEKGAPLLFCS